MEFKTVPEEVLRLHKLWLLGDQAGARANLRYANLQSADLQSANLRYANLQSANLQFAHLHSADLHSANLNYAHLTWKSHDLLAEILSRAAGDNTDRRKIAGLVLVSRDWCWEEFELMLADATNQELSAWVRSVLWPLGTEQSPAPTCLRPVPVSQEA
jgi:uncharacterized protein YjbI with pentapeptide repeats